MNATLLQAWTRTLRRHGAARAVVQALAASVFVADCTVEGLQHAVELPRILGGGARVLAISHEHPEILELDGAKGGRNARWHTDVTFVRTPPAY